MNRFRGWFFALSSLLLLGSLLLASCSSGTQNRSQPTTFDIRVRADVSLRPTLQELAQIYQQETGYKLLIQYLTTRELIPDLPGDSADVYVLANKIPEHFPAADTTAQDSARVRILAYAVPCIIVPQFNPALISTLSDLLKPGLRLGIVDPNQDVLGMFALEIFKTNNFYTRIEPQLVLAGPSALELAEQVARKDLDAALGWTVFPNWTQGSTDVVLLSSSEIPRIAVVYALRAKAPATPANADRLMTYLNSERCLEVFRQFGYVISQSDLEMYAPLAQIGGKPVF